MINVYQAVTILSNYTKGYLCGLTIIGFIVCFGLSFFIAAIICAKSTDNKLYKLMLSVCVLIVLLFALGGRTINSVKEQDLFITLKMVASREPYIAFELLFNVLLFVPFGACLAYQFDDRISARYCLVLSITIELSQWLLGCGMAEVSDVLMNMLGSLTAICIVRALQKTFRKGI